MGGDNTPLAQGPTKQLKIGLLEQALGRSFGIRTVSDDHIELVLAVLQELEAVTDVGLGVGVLESNAHAGEVLLGDTDDSLIDVT